MLLFGILCSCLALAHSEESCDPEPAPSFGPTEEQKAGALFLSEYIRRNETQLGRNKSRVDFFKTNFSVDAFSGYITTDQNNTNHIFFLYTKAKEDRFNNASVILWLYGGPGISALFAQFLYNGPVKVVPGQNMTPALSTRNATFQKHHHVIYLDAPAGSGYSFTNSTEGFAKTSEDVAVSIENFLVQFLELFPELKNRTLFVNGESYASRYAVALANRSKLSIKLGGVMLGVPVLGQVLDGLNPTNFLSCVGMLDENGATQLSDRFALIKGFLMAKNYSMVAYLLSQTVLYSDNPLQATLYKQLTGFSWHDSALISDMPLGIYLYYTLVNTTEFKNAIHVGDIQLESQRLYVVYNLASEDFAQDMSEAASRVLNSSLHQLIYTGQMDTVLPSSFFHSHFNNITWTGAQDFKVATRQSFFNNASYPSHQRLLYYKKEWKNLTMIHVGRAGHFISLDSSRVVFEIVNKFLTKYNKLTHEAENKKNEDKGKEGKEKEKQSEED